MKREDVARKTAVETANGASKKKPYVPPALEKCERLDEVVEGSAFIVLTTGAVLRGQYPTP